MSDVHKEYLRRLVWLPGPEPTRPWRRIAMDDEDLQQRGTVFCNARHPEDPRVLCHIRVGNGPLGHSPEDAWPKRWGPFRQSPIPHLGFGPVTPLDQPIVWVDPVRSAPGVNGKIKKPRPQRALEAGT